MTDHALIEVGRFMYVPEAYLAKAFLQEHDIPCVIADDNIVTVDPLASVAYGGVKLKVPREFADRAYTLIQSYESRASNELDPEIWPQTPETWPRVVGVLGSLVAAIALAGMLFGHVTFSEAWVWIVVGILGWAIGKYYPESKRAA